MGYRPVWCPACRRTSNERTGTAFDELHYIKDVALGEDASLIHCGQGPTVMALLREAALNLLRRSGARQISARLRYHSQYPTAAVALLIASPPAHA